MKTQRDLAGVPRPLPLQPRAIPNAFEGPAVVFDGPEDYHDRIDDPDAATSTRHAAVHARRRADRLSGRGRGGEHAPAGLPDQARAFTALPCIGDGRQSGTSGSPSILNASPEAAAGGGLAILRTGDRVRIDLNKGTADILISDRGTGAAPRRPRGGGRLQISRPPDAVAGNPARPGRPAGDRRGARAGRQVPAHRPDQGHSARQPLRKIDANSTPAAHVAALRRFRCSRTW